MQDREPFTPDRLFCPGPTPVPQSVQRALIANTGVYHRSEEFYRVVKRAQELLAPMFGTKLPPVILTASGTGGLEAALTALAAPGDPVTLVNAGKFGERWEKLAQVFALEPSIVRIEAGHAPTAAQIVAAIKPTTKAVFLQANETSTGAYFGIETLVPEIRRSFKGFIVVDAISSLGAHAMRMDEWGIDAVVAGSQKGFGLPPGLAS